ncbi:MAG TPA: hypothetical protein VER96_31065 [Polyangiaceae bacterium]|nr:hypothetical protein [Polyangiaceae bacterium]
MKSSVTIATFMALAAGAVGAGALDKVPSMVGSDPMKNLTLQVLANCTALHTLGDPITFDGTGSGAAENALKIVGPSSTQLIGVMTRAMNANICTGGPTAAQRAGAEGLVIALDVVNVVGNPANVGPEGIDYPGNAADPTNQWRTVLRLIYTGMDIAAGNNVFNRDCNSAARQNIVNNWDNVFHGTVTQCTDSHPSVPGTGANGYDQSNSIVEPGIRHAFRRDDESNITDVFLAQLNLSGISYAQGAPVGSTTAQAAAYRALSGSPFCNNKRPDDDWQPLTLEANATLGLHASQIPEMSNVGIPTSVATGLGYTTLLKGSTNAKNVAPYLNEYTDQDPIRRKCVGRGNNANANLPMEQVCSADGTLGVVLPIAVPNTAVPVAQKYPTLPCEPSKGFFFGPAVLRPTGAPVRCPNGDASQDSKCLLPVRTDASQPNGVAFDCINPPNNVPQAIFDKDGNGSVFTDSPDTDGRPDVDGRVYNLILRAANGDVLTATRPDPSRLGTIETPVVAAFYRIHSTRSLLLPPNQASQVCNFHDDSTDQIGCLTLASPCSLGYAGRSALANNPGVAAAAINGIENNLTTIQALVKGGARYPMARKLYLNSMQGFDILHNSDSTILNSDAEEEMAKCYATLPFNGTINVQSAKLGLVSLPPATGAVSAKPICEDFDGNATCSDGQNTDACVGNELIAGGVIPTSFCDNGLKDGDETDTDVCPVVRPMCNTTTHHCE